MPECAVPSSTALRARFLILLKGALFSLVIVPPSPAATEKPLNVVIDTEGSGYRVEGRFRETAAYQSHGTSSLVAVPDSVSTYRFTQELPRTGYYRLYAWWPALGDNSRLASYTIRHGLGAATLTKEQRQLGGLWNELGDFFFDAAVPAEVDVSNLNGSTVAVDAIRFLYLGSERPKLRVNTAVLPLGEVGERYAVELEASGGTPPYRWHDFGSLPTGVQLHQTGVLEGFPEEVGRFELKLQVEDSTGTVESQDATIEILSVHSDHGPGSADPMTDSLLTDAPGPVDVAAAEGDLSELLAIVESLQEGDWASVNENFYYEVWTPRELRPLKGARSNPEPFKIIRAWGSFAWDTRRGDVIIYGGGHANYSGNDVYRWRGSTRQWQRASLPSEITQDDLGNFTAIDGVDAAPSSAHTYDNNLYLPIGDRFMTYGGAAYDNGGAYLRQLDVSTSRPTGPYQFDPSKADGDKVGGTTGSHVQRVAPFPQIIGGEMWENRDIYANISGNPTLPTNFVLGTTAYAQENGKDVVFVNAKTGGSARQLFKHTIHDINDPTRDTWEHVGRFFWSFVGKGSGAYDPVLNVFVRTAEDRFTYWDLNRAGPLNNNVLFSPEDASGEFQLDGYFGMDYDPVRHQFALWRGDGTVWMLEPPPSVMPLGWRVKKQPPPMSAVPNGDVGKGILGKWKYIPNLDVFLGLQDPVEGNIWLYKPVGWVRPGGPRPPTVLLTAPVEESVFLAGSDFTLEADAKDADGSIDRVEFLQGSSKLGEDTETPYTYTWVGVPTGSYVLSAVAFDDDGLSATSLPVSVTVSDNSAPSISIASPVEGAVFVAGNDIPIQVEASDPDGNIVRVEFFEGNIKLGEDTTVPYGFNWPSVPPGSYRLAAVAVDDDNASATCIPVNVIVSSDGSATALLQDGVDDYTGTLDTYLDALKIDLNFGASTSLRDKSSKLNSLVRFAVFRSEGGPIPDGADIQSAVLSLYKLSSYDHVYRAHRLLRDWSEGDATWLQARPGEPWVEPGATSMGADLSAMADGESAVGWAAQWLEIDVTAGVRAWSVGQPNYGWKIVGVAGNNNIKRFHSCEETTQASLRPKLTIVFSFSEPTSSIEPIQLE